MVSRAPPTVPVAALPETVSATAPPEQWGGRPGGQPQSLCFYHRSATDCNTLLSLLGAATGGRGASRPAVLGTWRGPGRGGGLGGGPGAGDGDCRDCHRHGAAQHASPAASAIIPCRGRVQLHLRYETTYNSSFTVCPVADLITDLTMQSSETSLNAWSRPVPSSARSVIPGCPQNFWGARRPRRTRRRRLGAPSASAPAGRRTADGSAERRPGLAPAPHRGSTSEFWVVVEGWGAGEAPLPRNPM